MLTKRKKRPSFSNKWEWTRIIMVPPHGVKQGDSGLRACMYMLCDLLGIGTRSITYLTRRNLVLAILKAAGATQLFKSVRNAMLGWQL